MITRFYSYRTIVIDIYSSQRANKKLWYQQYFRIKIFEFKIFETVLLKAVKLVDTLMSGVYSCREKIHFKYIQMVFGIFFYLTTT